MRIGFNLNGEWIEVDRPGGVVLLDFLRDSGRSTGTREGCREGDCGSCMVLVGDRSPEGVDYQALNSCLLPLGEVDGRQVSTIEGLETERPSPLLRAMSEEGAVQCGFCSPGIVLAVTGFLLSAACLDPEEMEISVAGNLCRCTGYRAVRRALESVRRSIDPLCFAGAPPGSWDRIDLLAGLGFLPPAFALSARAPAGATCGGGASARAAADPDRSAHPPYITATEAGRVVAGGTDLYCQNPETLREGEVILLSRRRDLRGIREEDGEIEIGAGVTIEELRHSPLLSRRFPRWPAWMGLIAAPAIRRRATVAGNLVNASPIGDLCVLLLALDARLRVVRDGVRRDTPLSRFFKAYRRVDLNPGELVEQVRLPLPASLSGSSFEKVSRRPFLDIASVNSGAQVDWEETPRGPRVVRASLSAGGVAPVPLVLSRASAFVSGRIVDAGLARETAAIARSEIAPIDDARGSAEYKSLLLGRLILAHYLALFPGRISEGALL